MTRHLIVALMFATHLDLHGQEILSLSASLIGGPELNSPSVIQAQNLARQILSQAGIALDWCKRERTCSDWQGRLRLHLLPRAPESLRLAAMAEAFVFEGRTIRIYWNRLNDRRGSLAPAQLLAHVIVHEVMHLLQGCNRHSDSGIMKASWTEEDYSRMRRGQLTFAVEDLELLQHARPRRLDRGPDPSI